MSENTKDEIVLMLVFILILIPVNWIAVALPIVAFTLVFWRIASFLSRVRRA